MATQPGADGSSPTAVDETWAPEQGPIPYERFKPILENTRTKAHTQGEQAGRQAAQQEVQQQYGWALQLGPERTQMLSSLATRLVSDPVEFIGSAIQDLSQHPQYAPQIRSLLGKILATRGNGNGHVAESPQDLEPQPDLQLEGGYTTYSADQMRAHQEWRERQFAQHLLGQIRTELGPLQQDIAQRRERDTLIAATQQANSFARDTLTEMRKLPYFQEQRAEIEQVFRAMPPMADNMVGQAIRDAYIQVLTTKVLPTLSSTAKSDLLSSLNQKAAASARNPASGSVARAGRPTSFEEALRQADEVSRR